MTSETTADGAAPVGATTGLTRRRALCDLVVALAAPGVLAACSSEGSGVAPAPAPPAGTPVSSIPVGSGTLVEGPNGPVLLVQPTAGVVKAYSATCPHQGTTVDPPEGGTITCPNHGSQFDAASGALKKGPAQTGLTPVTTRVVNGAVQLA